MDGGESEVNGGGSEVNGSGAASGEDPICLPRAGLVALGAPWLPRAAIGLSWKAIWLPGG